MKTLMHNDDKLVLEYRPILFTGLFATVSFLTFAWGVSDLFTGGPDGWIKIMVSSLFLAFTLFMVERSRLTMDASSGKIEFRKVSLFRSAHQIYTIDEVTRFEVETSSSNDGNDTQRLVMIIDEGQAKGRYPLTNGYYSWLDRGIADTANQWLDRSRNTG